MQEKINRLTKKTETLKSVFIIISILSVIHLTYTLNNKYNESKDKYFDELFNELKDVIVTVPDFVDEEMIFDICYSKHQNDNVDNQVDSLFTIRKKEELNAGDDWIGKEVTRERIKNEILEKRVKYSAEIEINKEQKKLDAERELEYRDLEVEINKKMQERNFFSFLPFTYILGLFLGESIIPFFLWLLWKTKKQKLVYLKNEDTIRKIEIIKNNSQYGNEFNLKLESLSELEESSILDNSQFTEKKNILIQEYSLKIEDDQSIIRNEDLVNKLKKALELGNITLDEFEIQMKKIQ